MIILVDRIKMTGDLGRQHFKQMAVGVAEVKAAAAMTVVDLHVLGGARPAAIGEALAAHPVEDPVKLRLADFESVVMPLEAVPIVEIDGQGIVDLHRSEVRDRALVLETENPREEPSRFLLVS